MIVEQSKDVLQNQKCSLISYLGTQQQPTDPWKRGRIFEALQTKQK